VPTPEFLDWASPGGQPMTQACQQQFAAAVERLKQCGGEQVRTPDPRLLSPSALPRALDPSAGTGPLGLPSLVLSSRSAALSAAAPACLTLLAPCWCTRRWRSTSSRLPPPPACCTRRPLWRSASRASGTSCTRARVRRRLGLLGLPGAAGLGLGLGAAMLARLHNIGWGRLHGAAPSAQQARRRAAPARRL
jgi:hypothetical protein